MPPDRIIIKVRIKTTVLFATLTTRILFSAEEKSRDGCGLRVRKYYEELKRVICDVKKTVIIRSAELLLLFQCYLCGRQVHLSALSNHLRLEHGITVSKDIIFEFYNARIRYKVMVFLEAIGQFKLIFLIFFCEFWKNHKKP